MLFKRKRIPFPIPDDARELTEEEMILVNGGGKEQSNQQGSQDNNGETQTVKKGDTLSQIVSDYNKEHGTDLSVSDVAKMSGIENPDLIYPGQKINFGNQVVTGVTSAPQNVTQISPSIGGNIGSRHTVPSEKNYSNEINASNQSTRPISAATAITPATTASRKNTADTQTVQAVTMALTSNTPLNVPTTTTNTEPKYESTYYNQIVEKLKVHAAKDGIRETSIKGEEISGKQIEGQDIDGRSGNLTERGYPGSRDENLGIYSGTESIETETSLEKMKKSVEKNTKHKYNENASGFMCDNWLERVIDDAGFDSTKYLPAGNSYAKTCEEHIEAAKDASSGFTTTLPTEDGAYALFMGDGHELEIDGVNVILHEHAALLMIENGAMTVWDNSRGNERKYDGDENIYNIDSTKVGVRSSTQIDTFGYDSYYYKEIM